MRDRLPLPLRFDAEAMRRDVHRLEQTDWLDHFVRENYNGTWSVLVLRAPAGASHPVEAMYPDPAATEFVDTPALKQCPYLQQVLAEFRCPLQSVRLLKLTAGSMIKPHSDHDLSLEYGKARLHIPIETNSDVDFRLNDQPVILRPGECWYLRLSDPHSVINRGKADRIHLVIDAIVNPWLEELLRSVEGAVSQTSVPQPAASDLTAFRETVWNSDSLQQQLDSTGDRHAFVAMAIRIASEFGYRLMPAEIEAAMNEGRRSWREPVL